MGTTLCALVRECKGKKLADGKLLSEKDRLKVIRIDAIQNFYRRAIRSNKGNPQKMFEEIWAILHHYSSTENNLKHDKCPKGEKCWCSYQGDQMTDLYIYIPTKAPLPNAILDVFKRVFIRLVTVLFLEQHNNCSNQNANESFNSTVCSLSPKETFNSLMKTSLEINLAVCLFNDGFKFTLRSALSAAALSFTECSLQQW